VGWKLNPEAPVGGQKKTCREIQNPGAKRGTHCKRGEPEVTRGGETQVSESDTPEDQNHRKLEKLVKVVEGSEVPIRKLPVLSNC